VRILNKPLKQPKEYCSKTTAWSKTIFFCCNLHNRNCF